MRKITRFAKLCLAALAGLCALTVTAQPGPPVFTKKYHWHYFTLKTLPEGAGEVNGCHYTETLDELSWGSSADVRYIDYNSSAAMMTTFTLSARSTGGKAFLGWYEVGDDGTPQGLLRQDAQCEITHAADNTTDDNTESGYPEMPGRCYIALFGYIDAKAVPGQERMGSFTVPTEQEMNRSLTLTATPEEGYTFAYWMDSKGNKVGTDATLNVTVTGRETYTPVFEGGKTQTFVFPAGGALKAFGCADLMVRLPDNDTYGFYEITSDSLTNVPYILPQGRSPFRPTPYKRTYMLANEVGGLLYGEGMFTVTFTDEDLEYARYNRAENNLMKAVPAGGVYIENLESGYRYYVFDGNENVFNHVTTGHLEEHDAYLTVPEATGITQEQIFVFLTWEDCKAAYPWATDIKPIAADNNKPKGIYDLNGRKVVYTRKGLYIIDGKKQLIK